MTVAARGELGRSATLPTNEPTATANILQSSVARHYGSVYTVRTACSEERSSLHQVEVRTYQKDSTSISHTSLPRPYNPLESRGPAPSQVSVTRKPQHMMHRL